MDANQVLHIGPLQLPVYLLFIIIGIFISGYITEKMAEKRNWEKDKWTDLLIIVALGFILVYKFGWALFDIKGVIHNPESLLWITGTPTSLIFATLIAVVILLYKVKKNNFPIIDVLDFMFISFIITLFIYSLFIMDYGKVTNFIFGVSLKVKSTYLYHPVNWYRAFITGILLIFRYSLRRKINFQTLMYLYVFLGSGLLLSSMFGISNHLYLGFTMGQWLDLVIACIGGLGLIMKNENHL